MSRRQMPAKHLAAPAAVEADDVIAVDGSSHRNRRGSLDDGFCCRVTKTGECPMDGRNQGAELIGWDLMASEIRADDLGDEFGRLLIRHRQILPFPAAIYTTPGNGGGN